jgi:hypothetical protein
MTAMSAMTRDVGDSLIYPVPMKAWTLAHPAPIESNPLELHDLPVPEPGECEIRIRVMRNLPH